MTFHDSLAQAADENFALHATHATRRLPGARAVVVPDLTYVDSGLPCDTFNVVCRARMTSGSARERIAEALAFFARTGHPFSWWLTPGYEPAELSQLLAEAGLAAAESESAMALDLAKLTLFEAPLELEVRKVRTAQELGAYAGVLASLGSPPDPSLVAYYSQAAVTLLAQESPQRLYLGWLEGRAVATAELTIGGGVAGLYNISTLSEVRGRGIGTAMTAIPLEEARAAGHSRAILQAAPDGVRIYERLGFTAFGEVVEWKPKGGSSSA